MFMTWFMFSCILSLLMNKLQNQYSECELLCGQRLCWIQKIDNIENGFLKPEYPFNPFIS